MTVQHLDWRYPPPSQAHEWLTLTQHPITGEDDITFINTTIAVRTNSVEIGARERAHEASALASSG